MSSISLDLDFIGMYNLTEAEIIERLNVLKEYKVTTFAIPYEILLNKELKKYQEKLFSALSHFDFKLVLNACKIRNYSPEYIDEKNLEDSIAYHTQFIFNTYEMLKEYNLEKDLIITFKAGKCDDSNVAFILDKTITFFREISLSAQKIGVRILLELQEKNQLNGRVVGDNWQDITVICGGIQNKNFGILWNMANSRNNNLLENDLLVPPDDVIERVILPSLSNVAMYDEENKPYNVEMQFEEIKALIKFGFEGEFHLEFIYSDIYDKRLSYDAVYDSIEYLDYLLTYYYNQNKLNKLEINYNPEKMKRRYIRRRFDEDASAIIETNNYKLQEFDISEKYIMITSNHNFNFELGTSHQIIIKVKDIIIELITTLQIVRNQHKNYEYVFMINNDDRKTRKKICQLIYLVN